MPSSAATVVGGGSRTTDCAVTLDIASANSPAPPKTAKAVDCVDGDVACDEDGLRNGECVFSVGLCVNTTGLSGCTPDMVGSITVDHAVDDGIDRRFDFDFQALQQRTAMLGLPTSSQNRCAQDSTITVKLRGPDAAGKMKLNKKTLRLTALGTVTAGGARDVDTVKFTCRPGGNGVYAPTDLYTSTFDRIRKQVFAQSCALSGCHDSQGQAGGMILLPNSAYGNIVGVVPNNAAAATDGLLRVTAGSPSMSLLYRKITADLPAGYGASMPKGASPLSPQLIEMIRLWILGDGVNGPAPATGWVTGTDQ